MFLILELKSSFGVIYPLKIIWKLRILSTWKCSHEIFYLICLGLFRSLEPSRNNYSSFWGVALNLECWYLSLSSELHECLIQENLYSPFIEVVTFVFLHQGKAPCQCYSWLWSLAGCLVTAQLAHSLLGLQKGGVLRWGAHVWAPGFWHEHYYQ